MYDALLPVTGILEFVTRTLRMSLLTFNLPKNLLICFTYISPSDSEYYKNNDLTSTDLFEYIKLDCAEFMSSGNLLLMGDLNVYLPRGVTDFIEGDIMDDHVPLPDDVYQPDIPIPRNTMEMKNLNQKSKLLLGICKSVPLRILNGTVGPLVTRWVDSQDTQLITVRMRQIHFQV